jgi:threonine aldolase
MTRQLFLSDNASPAHPEILKALTAAGEDHYASYGDDPETTRAQDAIRELFDTDCGVYFVYNGTGANVSALRTITAPFQAVICTEMAHINEDEAGAPEAIGGFKLLPVHKRDGRLLPEDLDQFLGRRGFEHTSQPETISITQSTEVGTVYRPDRLEELCRVAHSHGFAVHMDGARIANAAAAWYLQSRSQGRECSPAEAMRAVSSQAGVDVLSFGATKNGLLFGEAVVFFDRDREKTFRFFRKQTTQLHSKMRYIATQFSRYLQDDDIWFANALRANQMAHRLEQGLRDIPGVEISFPVEANGVFATMPRKVVPALQEEFGFYLWEPALHMARLMVSWDTRAELIDSFVERCRSLVTGR